MNLMAHLLALLVLVTGVGGAIVLAARWTRLFTDFLWYFILAPRTVSVAVVLAMIAIGTITRAVVDIDLVSPLAFSIQLIVLPFAAVPLSDLIASWSEAAGGHGRKAQVEQCRRNTQGTRAGKYLILLGVGLGAKPDVLTTFCL